MLRKPSPADWRHVVKLDPDKPLPRSDLRAIARSGTDALIIGGTQGITRAKVGRLLTGLWQAPVPVLIEVSAPESLLPGADGYLIPVPLNSPDPYWLMGAHIEALRRFGGRVPWERVFAEGYIMMNPDSAAARRVGVREAPAEADVRAYVRLAAGLWRLPIIYLEYSGRLGDPRQVAQVRNVLRRIPAGTGETAWPRFFYGGGIADAAAAGRMAAVAHTIVVGNAIYQPDGLERLHATVRAVAESRRPPSR